MPQTKQPDLRTVRINSKLARELKKLAAKLAAERGVSVSVKGLIESAVCKAYKFERSEAA